MLMLLMSLQVPPYKYPPPPLKLGYLVRTVRNRGVIPTYEKFWRRLAGAGSPNPINIAKGERVALCTETQGLNRQADLVVRPGWSRAI